jgi:Protein of unknown function (DUF3604)
MSKSRAASFAMFVSALFIGLLGFPLPASAQIGLRVLLGVTDEASAVWDGSVSVDGARVTRLDPWRFGKEDEIIGNTSWKASTRPVLSFMHLVLHLQPPVGDNGVIIWLSEDNPNAEIKIKTTQGDFSLRLGDLPFGKLTYELGGRVAVDRIPANWRLTETPDEEDYPAAASGPNREIWLAYLQFRHNPNHDKLRAPMTEPIKDLSVYSEPTGGDEVFVKHFADNKWSEPIPVSAAGGDLYRPAIAVDGKGKVWVFWSDDLDMKGVFELRARVLENGVPQSDSVISKASGSDVFPVATTDSEGRVWVAWQGWRNAKAAIFSATEQGDGFSTPQQVSNSSANEWNPAIAADSRGRVSVAWDSYRNGSYDVYARTATAPGAWEQEIPVAATARYEAYPSITYDPQGRLWIAYEEGSEGWGKDWGAHISAGVPLYYARAIRLVGLDASGRLVDPGVQPGVVLPGIATIRSDVTEGRQADITGWEKPDPDLWKRRTPNAHPFPSPNPRNSLPRLQADASGRVWLAFRTNAPAVWGPLGTSWSEYVTSFDGQKWIKPIFLFRSDNILDNRPALVTRGPGDLVVIESSDSRREAQILLKRGWDLKQLMGFGGGDPYNNDLYANVIALPPASVPVLGKDLGAPPTPTVLPTADSERADAAAVRAYRFKSGDNDLKIVRGEFHRHSEISMDGGSDGTLLDQWRYILDAADLDWVGCCDHDNGGGREYSWWTTQKLTDVFYTPGKFAPLFSYERSVQYPEGHRNVVFAQRGVRTLPRLPISGADATGHAPDTQNFYAYLKKYNGVTASHTSATDMGTDWRDNDPTVEPVVEIYQGMRQNYEIPDGPRANSAQDSIGGWRPKGFVSEALQRGYLLGFQASSDHISTHQSYANALVTSDTREALIDALHKRHIYASTDNIIADVRSGSHIMGDVFITDKAPEISVKLLGTSPFTKVVIVKDGQYVYTTQPGTKEVEFRWRDYAPEVGKRSYYYVRGEQQNGEIVWASPMWITYTGKQVQAASNQ